MRFFFVLLSKYFVNSKILHKFALALAPKCYDGAFVYRLVLKIFILARGVRLPYALLIITT